MSDETPAGTLLELEGLRVRFATPTGPALAVDGLDLRIRAGEVLALVGESGCGKTATALAIMDLLPANASVDGALRWEGEPMDPTKLRGRQIAMIFQEPATALNPVLSVLTQVAEPLRVHRRMGRTEARAEVLRLLAQAGLPEPEDLLGAYPHQLSGGQRQRVMIAMALACQPRLLLADEPTTALDASVRAGILDTLARLRRELGLAILLVSHDLGVVRRLADRAAVIYAGRIVESAPCEQLFEALGHPYTRALLACTPDPFSDAPPAEPIPGQPPDARARPPGCAFHPRCPEAEPRCAQRSPALAEVPGQSGQRVACLLQEASP
jgi:oligopeptide/dipeptide ABC transporter ATP-binding protein